MPVTSVVFSANNKYLMSASRDKSLGLWKVPSEERIKTIYVHSEGVLSVVFSSDEKYLVTGS